MKQLFVVAVVAAVAVAGHGALTIEVAPPAPSPAPGIVVPPPVRGGSTNEPAAPVKTEDVLKFKNADTLHGKLLSANPDDGVRWSREDAKGMINFTLANVSEVQFANVMTPRAGGPRAVARLTNGDSLSGEIVALTKDALKLQTWYAGELAVKRPMIASVEPGLGSVSVVYAGPTALAEWQQRAGNRGGWTFKKGALVAAGGSGGIAIGRDVKLPDMASIECDVAWMGYINFYMLFYAENFENYYNSDCYALQISSGTVYLQRCQRNSGMNNVDQHVNVESLQRKNKARIALKINKQKKTVALFIDGALIKQWTDRTDFTGRGTGIGFVTQGQPTRVSNVLVTEWDGKLDLDAGSDSKAAEEDLVRLVNGDKLSGQLDSVVGGQVRFATSYAKLEIPMERVAEIVLATKNAEKPRRHANDLRAFFSDGNRLTIALDKLSPETLNGNSECFGKATFQRGAFQRLQFNIYDEAKESEEDDDWGDTPMPAGGRRIIRGALGGGIMIDGAINVLQE
ncbi:MAG: hypothetical protein FJ395_06540 [Verrucomicrobia bacterium]|nr:hypothetical protein [Verrucomicrobiota bacterium]